MKRCETFIEKVVSAPILQPLASPSRGTTLTSSLDLVPEEACGRRRRKRHTLNSFANQSPFCVPSTCLQHALKLSPPCVLSEIAYQSFNLSFHILCCFFFLFYFVAIKKYIQQSTEEIKIIQAPPAELTALSIGHVSFEPLFSIVPVIIAGQRIAPAPVLLWLGL